MDRNEMKDKLANTNAMKSYLTGKNLDQDFYDLSHACIVEVFGQPKKDQFKGNSHMAVWFASKQNIIREILAERQSSAS